MNNFAASEQHIRECRAFLIFVHMIIRFDKFKIKPKGNDDHDDGVEEWISDNLVNDHSEPGEYGETQNWTIASEVYFLRVRGREKEERGVGKNWSCGCIWSWIAQVFFLVNISEISPAQDD